MAWILGIDTGGTYTDGVVIDPSSKRILAKAKAFTTPSDLTDGIGHCIEQLSIGNPGNIALVSLSTTLATNAIVEGKSARVGLLMIGKAPEMRMPTEHWHLLRGRIDIKGSVKEDLCESEIRTAIEDLRSRVEAVAVSGYASVRNPIHEIRVRRMVEEQLNVPVVCAHELTTALGHDERTITAVLNAGLIPIIENLVRAVREVMQQQRIQAPIMIVKGDGSLMSETVAAARPIETILSGPAASIIGGLYLTGLKDAVILDMGGTTTDVAHVENGKTTIRRSGAKVGGWTTHVQAADISTCGLGGDSHLRLGPDGRLLIGPLRVQPLCVAGMATPGLIQELHDYRRSEEYELLIDQEWDCFSLAKAADAYRLCPLDRKIVACLESGPKSLFHLAALLERDAEALGLSRLVNQGVLTRISMTPTDVLHAAGRYTQWNTEIARLGAKMMADRMKLTVEQFLDHAIDEVTRRLTVHCLESLAHFDQVPISLQDDSIAAYFFQHSLSHHSGDRLSTRFICNRPIIAIGAPAGAWIPPVAEQLQTYAIIPSDADVANAIGAAVGDVMESVDVIIRPGKEHIGYIVHAPWAQQHFSMLEDAKAYAAQGARRFVEAAVQSSGGREVEVVESQEDRFAEIFGSQQTTYIETRIQATAIGCPVWKE